jgi:ATP-dependent DNA ligase
VSADRRLELNAHEAILDGEIVKLDADGRPQFYDLMRRCGPFALVTFEVLVLNGKDICAL